MENVTSFFVQPVTLLYIVVFALLLVAKAYVRIASERRTFHFRIYDRYQDVRAYVLPGLVAALMLNVVILALGITIPSEVALYGTIALGILSITLQFGFLTGGVWLGAGLIAIVALVQFQPDLLYLKGKELTALALFVALVLYVESWLMARGAQHPTYPAVFAGKRGKGIGVQRFQPIWLLPLFVWVPVEGGMAAPSWWPFVDLFPNGAAFLFVPIVLAANIHARATYPRALIANVSRQVRFIASVALIIAVASFWMPLLAGIVGLLAFVGRIVIEMRTRQSESVGVPLFTEQQDGLVVLGILPGSPAASLGIEVGERIVRVNGITIHDEKDFYYALNSNRAQTKLEMRTQEGEIRLVNRAAYANEHHEIGFIWLTDRMHDKVS
ncbi:MAG: PDZ domain-containing protein [Bacilli bacterium]